MVEADTNNDVVIEDFEDTYSNLTLKSTFMLKWLSARCSHARFVLKVPNNNNYNNIIINIINNYNKRLTMMFMLILTTSSPLSNPPP